MGWLKRLLRSVFPPTPVAATPRIAPAWHVEKQGRCRIYTGYFTLFGPQGHARARFPGRIVEWPGLPVEVYIDNPPQELRRHRHGSCFQLAEPNSTRFRLHWNRAPRDFDTARAYIEQLLDESVGSG